MDGYLGNFFEHGGQIIFFASAALVWLGFCALGAVLAGRERYQEATPIYGWALISFVFTAFGVFTPISFTAVAADFEVNLPHGDRLLVSIPQALENQV